MEVFDTKSFKYEIKDNAILVTHEYAKMIKEENIIPGTSISVNLLNLILESEDMFNYAILVFSGNLKNFHIFEEPDSVFALRTFTSKRKIYHAFIEAIKLDLINLTEKTRKRFHILKEMSFLSYYEQCHKDDTFELEIEGANYKFNVRDFFSLLKMDSLELANLLQNEDKINGVKKEYYLYALKKYFSSNYIISNYEIPPFMAKNYGAINSDTYVDTYSVNVTFTDESLINKVKLNPEFEDYIMSGLKDDFSLIEKCTYIYLKMCKVLTYDEEFYAAHQEGRVADKHKRIEHISEISLTNNSVVCYEFSKMYAYFLKRLGIDSKSYDSDSYGMGHDNVEFRCGKFIVLADALTSIFTGDLFNVKLNQKPKGLLCINQNADTQVEFNKIVDKVFDYVKSEEQFEYQEVLKTYSIKDLLESYRNHTDNYKEIPLEERIKILLEKVNSMGVLKGMDVYSYIKSLGNMCFTDEERKYNICFEIVKNNDVKSDDKDAMPIGILVVNENGFADNAYENNYFTYSPHEGMKQISYYTLKEYFENSIFEYIDPRRDVRIPGIGGSISL